MALYDIDDRYCPCGNSWIRVPNSTLFGDCYYCPHCDKIFQPTVKEVTKQWFSENFNSDRFEQIKNLALNVDARNKVYIIYEKDGYGGTQVDRVFLNESDARVYVTTEIMVNNSKTPEELAKKQEEQYEMHEVVERL